MADFDLDELVDQLREAAVHADAQRTVRSLLTRAFHDLDAVERAMSRFSGDDEVLFEDTTVSIWYCRFDPALHVPPHDHQTPAIIGVYRGIENNHFYLPEGGKLVWKSTKRLEPGDVIGIGPSAIHSVETADENDSYGIHVYLAALTAIERSLFDWNTGEAGPFTRERYDQMLRPSTTSASR